MKAQAEVPRSPRLYLVTYTANIRREIADRSQTSESCGRSAIVVSRSREVTHREQSRKSSATVILQYHLVRVLTPCRQSPTATSSHSPTSVICGSHRQTPNSAINDVDAHSQRRMNYPPLPQDRSTHPMPGPISPYTTSSYAAPGNDSTASYHGSPIEGSNDNCSPYQRPLPSNFPPLSNLDETSGQFISHATPAWQHHHHFPHTASTPYPVNQDRYICGTCSKAFSRPSSLKIHTYSHTGEKPWKCQIPGCGKTFSVRSNMKRHEKGCHGDGGSQNGRPGRDSPEIAP